MSVVSKWKQIVTYIVDYADVNDIAEPFLIL